MTPTTSVSDPTYYHYRLIRKISLRPERKYSYMAAALLGPAVIMVIYGWIGLLAAFASLGIILTVHAIVLKLTVRRIDEPWEKRFAFRKDWPWIGPLPVMDTNLGTFRRLHFHLFLVGSCISLLLYPWSGSAWVVALFFWHFWLLAPRLRLMWQMRKEKRDGVIRLSSREVSYYHR